MGAFFHSPFVFFFFFFYDVQLYLGTCSYVVAASAKLCIMMSGQSSSPVMHDACEDLGQNYLKADIIQSLALAAAQWPSSSERTRVPQPTCPRLQVPLKRVLLPLRRLLLLRPAAATDSTTLHPQRPLHCCPRLAAATRSSSITANRLLSFRMFSMMTWLISSCGAHI